jgi:hypothetical protein
MTHPLQPLPDETPSLVPPPRLPPILRGLIPPSGGGGGGGWRRPWRLRMRVLAIILLAAGGTSIALGVWLVPTRAPTFAVAGLFIAAQCYGRRRLLRSPDFDLFPAKIYLGAICGGAAGELLGQLVFHISPGAPRGALWLAVGAAGIGGACGALLGALCTMAVGGLIGGWLLWRNN